MDGINTDGLTGGLTQLEGIWTEAAKIFMQGYDFINYLKTERDRLTALVNGGTPLPTADLSSLQSQIDAVAQNLVILGTQITSIRNNVAATFDETTPPQPAQPAS